MSGRWRSLVDKWRGESKRGRTHLAVKLALPIVIASVGGVIVASIPGSIPPFCVFQSQYLPAPWLVGAGLAAFVGGRYFTWLRAPRQLTLSDRGQRGSGVLGQLAFVFVFIALVFVWFFEAKGTAHLSSDLHGVGGVEPITYYIRCAVYADRSHIAVAPYTTIVVALICFVAGRWLWSSHKDMPATPPGDQVSLS